MNPENFENNFETPPQTPHKTNFPLSPKEFLICLSPQKPIIKKNAQSFLNEFHKAATKLLENMKLKYIKELKIKEFEGGVSQRLDEYKARLAEAERLINEKIDINLCIEIMMISMNWIHPFFFKLADGTLSNLYDEALELTGKGMELLSLGYYKTKKYDRSIKYATLVLNIKPNNISMLRAMYSSYFKMGENAKANNVLNSAKKLINIKDFKILEEDYPINKNQSFRSRFNSFIYKNSYSLTTIILSGIFSYIFTKYMMKLSYKESFIYSLATSFFSFLTSFLFKHKKK